MLAVCVALVVLMMVNNNKNAVRNVSSIKLHICTHHIDFCEMPTTFTMHELVCLRHFGTGAEIICVIFFHIHVLCAVCVRVCA